MQLVERGRGTPLVFIPGLQGRWEYARITVEALARYFHVITFSLCDEPCADAPFDASRGLDSYADQVAAALDQAGVARAAICGLSFGGLVALRFAASRPERTDALVLASTPGPGYQLRGRQTLYARFPRLLGVVFLADAPLRAEPEVRAALPSTAERLAFRRAMAGTFFNAPLSFTRMAARARSLATVHTAVDCARIVAPTLVVTGEPQLDRVVDVKGSARYADLIRDAKTTTLERTGHQGSLTRPGAFASIVAAFVDRSRDAAA
jgi:3-oxoadipate enol-lactonase/4-carboxymuconolactone decarboxylase